MKESSQKPSSIGADFDTLSSEFTKIILQNLFMIKSGCKPKIQKKKGLNNMTYHIVLACAGGMSTSLLMNKMKESAAKKGIEIEIQAIGINTDILNTIPNKDILLLGPQIRFQESNLKQRYTDFPIHVIDMRDYGMMNGEKVLETAIQLIEEFRS